MNSKNTNTTNAQSVATDVTKPAVPRLSIVIPVFGNANLVVEMIRSIQTNTFADWELWAVDDGSGSEDKDVIGRAVASDARIHYIDRDRQPKGAPTCRNIGMEHAQGEYLIFFDSDDLITSTCLATRVATLDARPDLDFMVFPSAVVIDGAWHTEPHRFDYGYKFLDRDLDGFCRRTLPFVVVNNIYHTASLRSKKVSWDENLRSLQDADFNVQTLMAMKYDYAQVAPDYGYRIAVTTSVSSKIASEEHQKSNLYALEKFYKTIRGIFEHHFDSALYHGVLVIYNWAFTNGIDYAFAHRLLQLVWRFDRMRGTMFALSILSSRLLQLVMSPKLARQIPMYFHLRGYYRRERQKVAYISHIQGL